MFSCELCEIFKNICFTEHLWATTSTFCEGLKIFNWQGYLLENLINLTSKSQQLLSKIKDSPNFLVWKCRGNAQFPQISVF